MGSHFLLRGIFPTQGSNSGLVHCRQILYHCAHLGSPTIALHPLILKQIAPVTHTHTHRTKLNWIADSRQRDRLPHQLSILYSNLRKTGFANSSNCKYENFWMMKVCYTSHSWNLSVWLDDQNLWWWWWCLDMKTNEQKAVNLITMATI